MIRRAPCCESSYVAGGAIGILWCIYFSEEGVFVPFFGIPGIDTAGTGERSILYAPTPRLFRAAAPGSRLTRETENTLCGLIRPVPTRSGDEAEDVRVLRDQNTAKKKM